MPDPPTGPTKGRRKRLKPEDHLFAEIVRANLPVPHRQHMPRVEGRLWKLDFAWVAPLKVAVEVQGATFQPGGGRHARGVGYRDDCRKENAHILAGWLYLRVTSEMVYSGEALELIKTALSIRADSWYGVQHGITASEPT